MGRIFELALETDNEEQDLVADQVVDEDMHGRCDQCGAVAPVQITVLGAICDNCLGGDGVDEDSDAMAAMREWEAA